MRSLRAIAVGSVGAVLVLGATAPRQELPGINPNPNIERAGVLRDNVLTVALEAKQSLWHLDGDDQPGLSMAAFSEEGKSPLNPGPLVRVAQGAEIHVSVRNSLQTPITFFLPAEIRAAGNGVAADSIVIAPGEVASIETHASVPGNYVYRAMRPLTPRQALITGFMAGGIVIDGPDASSGATDRVFVMTQAGAPGRASPPDRFGTTPVVDDRFLFMINGLSWPRTERLAATAGDSLHWRIINATNEVHPMHLHGFYFRVQSFSPPSDDRTIRGAPDRMEVTERMPALSGMLMAWSAERAGNWIFHCHSAFHITPDVMPGEQKDHAMSGMGGLVLGINVAERPGARSAAVSSPKRRLRLIAISDKGFPASEPSMRFVLEEGGHRVEAGTAFSPTIELTRGEPVSIMVVNQLTEATAVHWHGIELESYNDGVAGVSGLGTRVAPLIAPRDSFEVRLTPPRSGTFIYHSHVDELRQQPAGLAGALIVRDPGALASANDHVFFLKGSRKPSASSIVDVNGKTNPDTVVLHIGKPARLRFISLASAVPNATVSLTARPDSSLAKAPETQVVQWRALAKDGADLPAAQQVNRLARQVVSIGETYDFEYTPGERGLLRLEFRTSTTGAATLLVRVPIRVE